MSTPFTVSKSGSYPLETYTSVPLSPYMTLPSTAKTARQFLTYQKRMINDVLHFTDPALYTNGASNTSVFNYINTTFDIAKTNKRQYSNATWLTENPSIIFNANFLRQTYKVPPVVNLFYYEENSVTSQRYGYLLYPSHIYLKPISVYLNNTDGYWYLTTKTKVANYTTQFFTTSTTEYDAAKYHYFNYLSSSPLTTPIIGVDGYDLSNYSLMYGICASRTKVNYPFFTFNSNNLDDSYLNVTLESDAGAINIDSTFVAFSAIIFDKLDNAVSVVKQKQPDEFVSGALESINQTNRYISFANTCIPGLTGFYPSTPRNIIQSFQLSQGDNYNDTLALGNKINTLLEFDFNLSNCTASYISNHTANSTLPNYAYYSRGIVGSTVYINYIMDCYYILNSSELVSTTLNSLTIGSQTKAINTAIPATNVGDNNIVWSTEYPPHFYSYKTTLLDSSNNYYDSFGLNFYLTTVFKYITQNSVGLHSYIKSDFNDLSYELQNNSPVQGNNIVVYPNVVAFGDNSFVCLQSGSTTGTAGAYTSDNGSTWNIISNLPNNSNNNFDNTYLTYGGGNFVSFPTIGQYALYSSDKINWNSAQLPRLESWRGVVYGGGMYIAYGSSASALLSSYDAITWKQMTNPTVNFGLKTITFTNNLFIATFNNSAYTYQPNSTWSSSITMPINSLDIAAYGNGTYVGYNRQGNLVYSTTNGASFLNVTQVLDINYSAIGYGGGYFLLMGGNSKYAYSTDGITWTTNSNGSSDVNQIGYGNGTFIITRNGGQNLVFDSTDLTKGFGTSEVIYLNPSNSNSNIEYIQYTSPDLDPNVLKDITCTYGKNQTPYVINQTGYVPVSAGKDLQIFYNNYTNPTCFTVRSSLKNVAGELNSFEAIHVNLGEILPQTYNLYLQVIDEKSNSIVIDSSYNTTTASWPGIDLTDTLICWYYTPVNGVYANTSDLNLTMFTLDASGNLINFIKNYQPILFDQNTYFVGVSGYNENSLNICLSSQQYNITSCVQTNSSLFNIFEGGYLELIPTTPLNNLNQIRQISFEVLVPVGDSLQNIPNNFALYWTWSYDDIINPATQPITAYNSGNLYSFGQSSGVTALDVYIQPPISTNNNPNVHTITVNVFCDAQYPPLSGSYSFEVDDFPPSNIFNADFETYYNKDQNQAIADTRNGINTITRPTNLINIYPSDFNFICQPYMDTIGLLGGSDINIYWLSSDGNLTTTQYPYTLNDPIQVDFTSKPSGLYQVSLNVENAYALGWLSAHNISSTTYIYSINPPDFYKNFEFIAYPQFAWLNSVYLTLLSNDPTSPNYYTIAQYPSAYGNTISNSESFYLSANKSYFNQYNYQSLSDGSISTITSYYGLTSLTYDPINVYTNGLPISLTAYNNTTYPPINGTTYYFSDGTNTSWRVFNNTTQTLNTNANPFSQIPKILPYNDLYLSFVVSNTSLNLDLNTTSSKTVTITQNISTIPVNSPAIPVSGSVTYVLSSVYWSASTTVPYDDGVYNLFTINYGDPYVLLNAGDLGLDYFILYAAPNIIQQIPSTTFKNVTYNGNKNIWNGIQLSGVNLI